jgi:hypothetical protein
MRQAACCVKIALRNQTDLAPDDVLPKRLRTSASCKRRNRGQIGTVPHDVQFCTNFGDSNPLALSVEVN